MATMVMDMAADLPPMSPSFMSLPPASPSMSPSMDWFDPACQPPSSFTIMPSSSPRISAPQYDPQSLPPCSFNCMPAYPKLEDGGGGGGIIFGPASPIPSLPPMAPAPAPALEPADADDEDDGGEEEKETEKEEKKVAVVLDSLSAFMASSPPPALPLAMPPSMRASSALAPAPPPPPRVFEKTKQKRKPKPKKTTERKRGRQVRHDHERSAKAQEKQKRALERLMEIAAKPTARAAREVLHKTYIDSIHPPPPAASASASATTTMTTATTTTVVEEKAATMTATVTVTVSASSSEGKEELPEAVLRLSSATMLMRRVGMLPQPIIVVDATILEAMRQENERQHYVRSRMPTIPPMANGKFFFPLPKIKVPFEMVYRSGQYRVRVDHMDSLDGDTKYLDPRDGKMKKSGMLIRFVDCPEAERERLMGRYFPSLSIVMKTLRFTAGNGWGNFYVLIKLRNPAFHIARIKIAHCRKTHTEQGSGFCLSEDPAERMTREQIDARTEAALNVRKSVQAFDAENKTDIKKIPHEKTQTVIPKYLEPLAFQIPTVVPPYLFFEPEPTSS